MSEEEVRELVKKCERLLTRANCDWTDYGDIYVRRVSRAPGDISIYVNNIRVYAGNYNSTDMTSYMGLGMTALQALRKLMVLDDLADV